MSEVINKLTHGLYVVTTVGGGCVVDAVCQISGGEKPLISISVNKNNYTNELLKKKDKLVLSILSKKVDGKVIENFGFHSMRDYNKFENVKTFDVNGINVPNDIVGYIELTKEDMIENETHTVFITRVVSTKLIKNDEELTYNYYKEHKDEFIKVKTIENKTAWICTICGYVYYGEGLPDDFVCPLSGVDKSLFKKQ